MPTIYTVINLSIPKKPSEISTADLLELLNSPSEVQSEHIDTSQYENDVFQFVEVYKIEQGNNLTPSKHLYALYRAWSKFPLDHRLFVREMKKLFRDDKHNNDTLLLTNKRSLGLAIELYNLSKPKNKTKSKSYKAHFDAYLNHYNIKSGRFFVTDRVLYNLYDKWTYNNKARKSLGFYQFNEFCKLYFTHKKISNTNCYGVKKDVLNHFTKEEFMKFKKKKVNKGKI